MFLISCNSSQKRTPIVYKESKREYGGKVKRIIEYSCSGYMNSSNVIIKNNCEVSSISDFDKYENTIKCLSWNTSKYPDEPDFSSICKINDLGLVTERRVMKKVSSYGWKEEKDMFTYNGAGFRTECVYFSDGKLASRDETVYDEYNCPVKNIYYDQNNKVSQYYVYEFDNKNREIVSLTYNAKDQLQKKKITKYDNNERAICFTYDEKGKLLEKEDENDAIKDNKVDKLYSTELPDKGYTNIEYYLSKKVKTWQYKNQYNNDVYQTFDENGRAVEIKIYSNKEWQDTYAWRYREDGAILEKSESTSRILGKSYHKTTTYYKVDFNGNWIEEFTSDSEDRFLGLHIREIEYY